MQILNAVTEINGITFENCGSPLSSAASNSIRGLLIDDCTFRNYTGAAIDLALRAGRVDDSCRHLETLEERYPARVPQARRWLSDWRWLNALLERNTNLHDDLRRRAPAFFAA